jgi:hypothetical protein
MSFLQQESDSASGDTAESAGKSPGKTTATERLPLQRKAAGEAHGDGASSAPVVGDDPFGFHLDGSSSAPIQAKAGGGPMAVPAAETGTSSTGIPMPVQRKMEASFGADFSDVQVHAGSTDASKLGALAYTQGSDIHFAPGQYDPHSSGGQELLGHELAHVVQQRDGRVNPTTEIRGKGVNDDDALEREADVQGALAAQGKPATSAGSAASSGGAGAIQRQVVQRRAGVIQLKGDDSSFPEGVSDEELLSGKADAGGEGGEHGSKKPVQAKRAGGPVQRRAARPVVQLKGGATVGKLEVVSNAVGEGLTAGHAWLAYTPTGGAQTTYGTWGNRKPIGLHRDLEAGKAGKARRATDIDAADLAKLDAFATSNNAWSFTNNCASFAARGWLAVTGESLAYTTAGIPNPSALGKGIVAAGGVLQTGGPTGSSTSSNSSGSSYGSSSMNSVKPGSSSIPGP